MNNEIRRGRVQLLLAVERARLPVAAAPDS